MPANLNTLSCSQGYCFMFQQAGGLVNPQHLLKLLWGTKRAPHSPPQPIALCCLVCIAQGCIESPTVTSKPSMDTSEELE